MSTQPNTDNKFNLPGSILHYPKSFSFKIDYMMLKMEPDFNSKTLKDCEQQLRITTNKDTNEIKLDIAELDIEDVCSLSSNYIVTEFDQKSEEDKLIIKFNKKLPKMLTIDLVIKYLAGYNHIYGNIDGPKIRTPQSGFYFISFV